VLSLAFQEGRGLSPLQSGLLFLPQPIGTLIVAVRAGRILAGSGPRPLLVAGVAFSVVGSVLLLFFDRSPFGVLVAAGLLVNGVAGGLIVPAIHGMIAEGAPPDLVGIGSAALNASRQIGGVLGVATLGAIVGSGDVLAGARTAVAFAGLSQLMLVALIAWRVRAARRSPALVAPDCEMASA
jgi:DHA2 family methylenomycin A resistance protein-like MFS transporter